MIESLPANSSSKLFLIDNCNSFLGPTLKSYKDDTGLATDTINKLDIVNDKNIPFLTTNTNKILGYKYSGQSGIYIILNTKTGDMYIGSSIHFYNRFTLHLQGFRNSNNDFTSILYNSKDSQLKDFKVKVIINFPNYYVKYLDGLEVKKNISTAEAELAEQAKRKIFKEDPALKYIFDAFTQYQIRIYEQALISYYKPNLNDFSRPVTFQFTN